MTVSVRKYREEDREQYEMIWTAAFHGGEAYPSERPVPGPSETVYVAEQDGRVAGTFTIRPSEVTCRKAALTCGGIASVAVSADSRKHGVGRVMMTSLAEIMREEGLIVGNLRASHESFYRRFGWESCGREVRITSPVRLVPQFECALPVRQMRLTDFKFVNEDNRSLLQEEWAPLKTSYDRFARAYSGMLIRESMRWGRLRMTSGSLPYVFVAGDPVEAYAVLRISSTRNQDVIEFAWSTLEGYQSVLGTLAGVAINHATLSWTEPSNGPFLSTWFTQGIEAELRKPSMFQVLDVPGSLSLLKPTGSGSFTLAVEDEILPVNRGPWRVAYTPEGVEVAPSDTADVQLTIQQYAQVLMGEPSFSDLLSYGLALCSSDRAAQAVNGLFDPQVTYSLEIF